jgi:hypothetical protein
MREGMTDGADGADAVFGLTAYARAWEVKRKMASAASVASGFLRLKGKAEIKPTISGRATRAKRKGGFTTEH